MISPGLTSSFVDLYRLPACPVVCRWLPRTSIVLSDGFRLLIPSCSYQESVMEVKPARWGPALRALIAQTRPSELTFIHILEVLVELLLARLLVVLLLHHVSPVLDVVTDGHLLQAALRVPQRSPGLCDLDPRGKAPHTLQHYTWLWLLTHSFAIGT